ncbi:MAG: PD-(D/E)XK nuclease family protein [Candidatus Thorarchaeota archaeon]
MSSREPDITRREFKHGKVAYGFHWNKTHHERLGKHEGDLASLWAHMITITLGKVPSEPFSDPFYARASSLKLPKMNAAKRAALRNRFFRTGSVTRLIDSDLIDKLREYHRATNDLSYNADHKIVREFLYHDPSTIAIEVPVWSDRYRLSGHIDLLRFVGDTVEVCDYKPGPLQSIGNRFLEALPQIAAYGEMMAHHLAATLRSAFDAPLLPKIRCCIFDTHACWEFGAEMFVTLLESGKISGF